MIDLGTFWKIVILKILVGLNFHAKNILLSQFVISTYNLIFANLMQK